MKRLAIVTTHPIQYYAPVFKLLSGRGKIDVRVFYTLGNTHSGHDHGFGQPVSWDIPLLEGYAYEWLKNTSASPGSHHFSGIVNPDVVTAIERYAPDALLVFGWAYRSHLKILRHFKGRLPVYFRGDSTLLNEPRGVKKQLRNIFLRWIYSHVSHAFYVGKSNRAYYIKYGLSADCLSFAPHAVDNGRFKADRSREANALRSELNISDNSILVLYAGKFDSVKNVQLLLNAFDKLNKQGLHLLLAGNGAEEDMLREMAKGCGTAGNIHFTGFKNQTYMPVLYQAADLFCLPSKSETWGLSINEAMACSRAVLVSDKVGCAADLVTEANGAIFIAGDVDSLAGQMDRLAVSRAALAERGLSSAAIIKDWNFLHVAEAIENKLLNETTGPY